MRRYGAKLKSERTEKYELKRKMLIETEITEN